MSVQDISRSRALVARDHRASDRTLEEREIVELTHRMAEAWNRNHGAAYGQVFTEDCDYVAFDGTHLKGRAANARHHQALFDTVLKGSWLVFEGRPVVRFLAPDVAVMHAMGSVLLHWQTEVTPKRRSNQTCVVVRRPEGWRITAFHNTRTRPMKLPSGAMLRVILFFMRLRAVLAGCVAEAKS